MVEADGILMAMFKIPIRPMIKPMTNENIDRLLRAIQELLHTHASEIDTAVDDAVDRRAALAIAINIDCVPKAPVVKVTLSFVAKKIKDPIDLFFEDPDQPRLALGGALGEAVRRGEVSMTLQKSGEPKPESV